MRAIGETGYATGCVVVPHGAAENHVTDGRRVGDRRPYLVNGQLGVPDGDQPDLAHPTTVSRKREGNDPLRRRARRTIAAVPRTAAAVPAAPAAVSAASLRAILRPATACRPARAASSAVRAVALSYDGRHPAARSAVQSTTHGYTM